MSDSCFPWLAFERVLCGVLHKHPIRGVPLEIVRLFKAKFLVRSMKSNLIPIWIGHLLILLGLAAMAGSVRGGEKLPQQPSLADYLRVGIANNPGLQSEYEKHQAALLQIPQAKSLPDPKIMATSFVREIETRTGPQRGQMAVGQTFPWFGKLRLRGEMASKEAQAIYHQYENSLLHLHRDISLAYYDYAYLGKATEITGKIIDLLERLEPSVKEKVRVGNDLASLLRLQVEIGKNRDALQALKKERQRQSAALLALLGQRGGESLPWAKLEESKASVESRSELEEALLRENPELKAMAMRIEKSDQAVKLSKLSPIPDSTIGVNYLDTGPAMNPSMSGSGEDPWGVQISFNIPLWFSKYKAEKKQALANRRGMAEMLTDRQNTLLVELEAAWEDSKEADERIALYTKTLLPTARQAVEVSEESYKANRSTILDVIDSERTLLELEKTYWRSVANRHSSLVRLKTLVGKQQE